MACCAYLTACIMELAMADVPTAAGPLHRDGAFLSFTHRDHPGNRIGYRFHEHEPYRFGEVPPVADPPAAGAAKRREAEFAARPGVLVNRIEIRAAGWCPQDWTYYIVPVADGFELLWVIDTHDTGLNELYAVQQCFRLGGATNSEWRRAVAETPAFSEYDLWAAQEHQGAKLTSLSYVHAGGAWIAMPAVRGTVGYRTPLGVYWDKTRAGGDPSAAPLEPYNPDMSEAALDCGLVARTYPAGEWVCGLLWEQTTHITNHHPADCLHAVVNIGPLPPRGKRAIRGKIYWLRGGLEELYESWQRDFPKR
ncbi:MAG: hypothetical protein JXR94_19020 [Candidatus Hydrogenedentes bacterium]|nr:hypothetical protein [Candidatus Hydrogenedentota bacterium]